MLRVAVGQLETRVGRTESDVDNLKAVQSDIHRIMMDIQGIKSAQELQASVNQEREKKDEERDEKLENLLNNKRFIVGVIFGLSIVFTAAYELALELFKTYIKS